MIPVDRRRAALVIGEALIDIVDGGGGAREFVGGGPANIAIGLARWGHQVRLLTRIGQDERGLRIALHLRAEGVSLFAPPAADARTSTAHARIGRNSAAEYRFDIDWQIPQGVDPAGFSLVHAGSLGLFIEPGGARVLDILRRTDSDTVVSLDPNIRPSLIADRERAVERFEDAARVSDLVKLSDEDAAWLYPGLSPEQTAARILSLQGANGAIRPRAVVVTLGSEGALAVVGDAVHCVRAPEVQVVDTISAGDSFMASLMSSILDTNLDCMLADIDPVLERAAAAAAFAVSRAGANPPRRTEMEGLRSTAPGNR